MLLIHHKPLHRWSPRRRQSPTRSLSLAETRETTEILDGRSSSLTMKLNRRRSRTGQFLPLVVARRKGKLLKKKKATVRQENRKNLVHQNLALPSRTAPQAKAAVRVLLKPKMERRTVNLSRGKEAVRQKCLYLRLPLEKEGYPQCLLLRQ